MEGTPPRKTSSKSKPVVVLLLKSLQETVLHVRCREQSSAETAGDAPHLHEDRKPSRTQRISTHNHPDSGPDQPQAVTFISPPSLTPDVQEMLTVKVEVPGETSHGVGLQVPESSYIKEELEEVFISQEEKQLCVKEESSTASFPVSTTSIKSEDDAETPLFSQLHEHLKEEDVCPTNRSNHQMTEIISDKDSGGAESIWNPNLNAGVEIYNFSETEVSEDDEEYRNVNHPNFEMKRLSESDTKDSERESRASVVKGDNIRQYLIPSDCGDKYNKPSLKRSKTQGCGLVTKKCVKVKKIKDSQNAVQTQPTSFTCDDCGKTFNKKPNLNKHKIIHTGDKPFCCDICGYRSNRKAHLDKHVRIHTGEKRFCCDLCGYRCNGKSRLDSHRRIHTGEKPFCCDLCEHSFRDLSTLIKHRKIHTGEKPFHCDLCGHSFSQKSHLDDHRRIHTGEKPYRCDLCGNRFSGKSSLRQHRRIHTGEKPFCCDLCGHHFGFKSALNKHMRFHTGEKPFCCGICGYSVSRKSTLDKHMVIHARNNSFS